MLVGSQHVVWADFGDYLQTRYGCSVSSRRRIDRGLVDVREKRVSVREFWTTVCNVAGGIGALCGLTVCLLQEAFPDEFPPLGWEDARALIADAAGEWCVAWCSAMSDVCCFKRSLVDILIAVLEADSAGGGASDNVVRLLLCELRVTVVRVRHVVEILTDMRMDYGGTALSRAFVEYTESRDWVFQVRDALGIVVEDDPQDGVQVFRRAGLNPRMSYGALLRQACFDVRDTAVDTVWLDVSAALGAIVDGDDAAHTTALRALSRCWDAQPRLSALIHRRREMRRQGESPCTATERLALVILRHAIGVLDGSTNVTLIVPSLLQLIGQLRTTPVEPIAIFETLALYKCASVLETGVPDEVDALCDALFGLVCPDNTDLPYTLLVIPEGLADALATWVERLRPVCDPTGPGKEDAIMLLLYEQV